jgi:hypothetical protein
MKLKNMSFQLCNVVMPGIVLLVLASCALASEKNEDYISALPKNLSLQENSPQNYQLTVDYYIRDVYGNLTGKMRVTGEYSRALPGDLARWKNVRFAKPEDPNSPLGQGQLQERMQGFTYKPSGDVLDPKFFKDIPATAMEIKVLIWDMFSIESLAWNYFDKLKLNEAYHPNPGGQTFQMSGSSSFRNRELKLTWEGVSKMNGETSALLQYESLFNPLDINTPAMQMKGRTNYWGNIWVSLEDKQIEHATLYEDGLMEMLFAGQSEKTLINVFREITFQKVLNTKAAK